MRFNSRCERYSDIPESYIGVVTARVAVAASAKGLDFTIIVGGGLGIEGIWRGLEVSIRPILKAQRVSKGSHVIMGGAYGGGDACSSFVSRV